MERRQYQSFFLVDQHASPTNRRWFDIRARRPKTEGRRRGEEVGYEDFVPVEPHDCGFRLFVGIADLDMHEETVELRFEQRIGALLLYRFCVAMTMKRQAADSFCRRR
ncbi:hypothetical protein EV281_10326 [Rhizobium sp. BK418]|nr:hypothetical protein EV281_10326 [Rhizobium sp. BK418]